MDEQATHARSSPEDVKSASLTGVPPLQPYGFWETLGWAFLALAATFLVEFVFVFAWRLIHPGESSSPEQNGALFAVRLCIEALVETAVFISAIRLAGGPVLQYLGLVRPRARDVVVGIACVAALLLTFQGLIYLSGAPIAPSFANIYRSARDAGALPLLWFAIVIVAPIDEEIMFRGFLFRGWAESRFGVRATIVLTAFAWTLTHLLDSVGFLIYAFFLGLIFGWLRWRSGSTILTIVLHMIVNVVNMASLEWRS